MHSATIKIKYSALECVLCNDCPEITSYDALFISAFSDIKISRYLHNIHINLGIKF